MVRVVNIKENMPPADYAIYLLSVAIDDAKKMGEKAIIVLHGYGSNGVGGEIKKAVNNYLATAKKYNEIVAYVPGEKWGELNPDKILICDICPDLNFNSQVANLNSGVTVVLVSK